MCLFAIHSGRDFRAYPTSAYSTPDKANHCPNGSNYCHEHENPEGNEDAHRIFHRKFAAYAVETVKAANRCGQRDQIILRHLKDVFVRVILRFPGKQLSVGIHFDMSAQNETDWAILDETGDAVRARNIRGGVVDKKPGGHQKVTSKQQSRITVVKRDFRPVVPRRRDHIHCSFTEIDLSETVWPSSELVVAPNAVDIKSNHLSIGTICELWITGAMIEVPMGMNDKQSRLCGSISRKQAHHRVCQRNNFWICNIACVDQKRLR
jgi:hypothetical protein